FELLTAIAFQHFAVTGVDLAIVEVGLGGRLDSTNVITPEISIITHISYDHMQVLGNTLAEIAGEKAGILKPGVPAISTPQDPEAAVIIRRRAAEVGAPLLEIGVDAHLENINSAAPPSAVNASRGLSSRWTVRREALDRLMPTDAVADREDPGVDLIDWRSGEHQLQNAVAALTAVAVLQRPLLTEQLMLPSTITSGMAHAVQQARLPGRLEVLHHSEPLTWIADGAHNRASIEALLRTLPIAFPHDTLTLLFGCAIEKDVSGMLAAMAHSPIPIDQLIFTRTADNPKAANADELRSRLPEPHPSIRSIAVAMTLPEAIRHVQPPSPSPPPPPKPQQQKSPESADAGVRAGVNALGRTRHLAVVTGSFYLAGEAMRIFGVRPAVNTH
ncbi:MAG: bifunctional folylpolyglutamate synthase/dihydrofolate synthase, partial [Planctomycetota bacterium]